MSGGDSSSGSITTVSPAFCSAPAGWLSLEGASVAIVCWQLMVVTVTMPTTMVKTTIDGDKFSHDDDGDGVMTTMTNMKTNNNYDHNYDE
jgi:hypothetical protein